MSVPRNPASEGSVANPTAPDVLVAFLTREIKTAVFHKSAHRKPYSHSQGGFSRPMENVGVHNFVAM